ncbi:MAG: thiamine diphosphokinase [Anaerolineae bacterium]|nr:thiamine diphosphokinase [Candidatus Roseilinea sp.]MDW8448528.1 thiamine diphosphokinase [Anaerolineae bacterium]
MRIVIIANGDPPAQEEVARWLDGGATLICADGGARTALALGLAPAHVIGDFDSLSEDDLRELERRGAQLHRYPARKDETDLELALLFAARSARVGERVEIIVLGARGGRLDHELANMLLLAMPALKCADVSLAHGRERVFLIDARDRPAQLVLRGSAGDTVSLLPFGGDAHGIRTAGLEYPLHDESLFVGPARGVSNVMLGEAATVSLRQGMLLCVVIHHGQLPTHDESMIDD